MTKNLFGKLEITTVFYEYSAHFFTLKMMLKYSLPTINGRQLKKGLRLLLWWINLQQLFHLKLFLKFFFAKNHCEIQVRIILVGALYPIKMVFYWETLWGSFSHIEKYLQLLLSRAAKSLSSELMKQLENCKLMR